MTTRGLRTLAMVVIVRSLAPRTSLLLATALIVACGVAAPALAGITRLHGTIEGGPAFAGTQALGAFEAPGGFSVRTIYPRLDASPPTHVATRPDGQLQLAASSSLLALQRVRIGCPGEPGCKYESYELESDDLFVSAPPGAPFSCVVSLAASGCTRQRAPCRLSVDVLVAQTRLALQSCVGELSSSSEPQPESAEAGTLMIDESANPPSEQLLPQIVLPQAMAGPWLVGLAPNWESLGPPPLWLPSDGPAPVLVERNLLTGAEPLRIALPRIRNAPSLLNPGSYPATAAVQEDGTVAYLLPAGDHSTLWTASPTEPAPREIGAVAVDPEQRGDTLSVDEPILREGRLAIDTGTQVIIEALDGKQVTAVHGLPLGGIDFDGQHLLAAATPCTESFLASWTFGEPSLALPNGRCPAAKLLRNVSFRRSSIRVRIRCPALPPLGCSSTGVEAAVGPELYALSRPTYLLPGAEATLSVSIGKRWRRWFASHRRARVTVRAVKDEETRVQTLHVRAPY